MTQQFSLIEHSTSEVHNFHTIDDLYWWVREYLEKEKQHTRDTIRSDVNIGNLPVQDKIQTTQHTL